MRICVWGGGGELAGELIQHWYNHGHQVTAVCRKKKPIKHFQATCYFDKLPEDHPKLDLLVTMPGSVNNAKLQHMTDRQWEDVITDNLTAVFNAFKACLPKMYPNSNIVVVGSIVGSTGGFGCSNYAAAKAGLMGLVRGVANELACLNVRINLLELGYIDCGMGKRLDEKVKTKVIETIPLKRFGTVEDFLTAVDYLCQTKYMTGNTLTLAGGLR